MLIAFCFGTMSLQRAKTNYKDAGGDADDSDEERKRAKKQQKILNGKQKINEMEFDENGEPLGEININKKFAIYESKDKEEVFKKR